MTDTPRNPGTHPQGDTLAPTTPLDDLHAQVSARLDAAARAWFDRALTEAATRPRGHGPISTWELRLAEAGRRCGPEHADAVRLLILEAARADADTLARVYRQGTAAERRAVLNALPHLVQGPEAVPLVEDALRTNDTRLVAAALGPYAARHLDAHAWRQAVLKCLFTGVPVDEVADLPRRARDDAELARMLGDYAAERTAAGRPVPQDLHRALTLTAQPPPRSAPPAGPATGSTEPPGPAGPPHPGPPSTPSPPPVSTLSPAPAREAAPEPAQAPPPVSTPAPALPPEPPPTSASAAAPAAAPAPSPHPGTPSGRLGKES